MPYLCIFVEEVVALLWAMAGLIFACELWVKRVGTFGVVLYRTPMTRKFHFVFC